MADGRTHDLHGLVATIMAVAVCAPMILQQDMQWAALPIGVFLGTWLVSPDLDMWNTTPTRRWGPLRILWAPYCWLFDHRGLSHGWFTGPLSRLLYMGIPISLVWWFFGFEGAGPWVGLLAIGITLGNWVHLLGDS